MKLTNTFKQNREPEKQVPDNYDKMSKLIGRDARPVQRLNPPVFEEDLRQTKTTGIALAQSCERVHFKMFR